MLGKILLLAILQGAMGLISWDTACGVTKGCFPDCQGGCEYLVTWQLSGSSIAFTLQAEETDTDAYLSIAFSDDLRMGDDSVVGCIPASSAVISAFNEGTDTETLSPTNLGLSATSVSQANGVITCSFTRDISNSANSDKFFDLNDDYLIMLLIGEAEDSELGHHYVIPWTSENKVDFNAFEIVDLYKLNSPAVKLHGIMMVLAWLLCSVIGIITARYNKEMLAHKTLFGSKVWFQLHRGSFIGVLVFVVIGFIPIFVELEGYSQIVAPSSESIVKAHPVLGIIVTIFTFANPIAAFVRPGPDHKYRWVFNWGHRLLGISTQVLAVVAVILGYILERSQLTNSAIYVNVVLIVAVIAAAIVLEVLKWKSNGPRSSSVNIQSEKQGIPDDSQSGPSNDNVPEKQNGGPPDTLEMDQKPETARADPIPFYILIAVGIVTFGLTMGILGIIAAS